MTSRTAAEIYNTTCHVVDADTVVVGGSRFVRERTCKPIYEGSGCVRLSCGCEPTYCDCAPNFCMDCGAKVVGE